MIADTPHSPGVHAASRSARHVKWIANDMVTTISKSCYGGLDEGNLSNAPAIHRASQYKKGRHFDYPQILLIWVMLIFFQEAALSETIDQLELEYEENCGDVSLSFARIPAEVWQSAWPGFGHCRLPWWWDSSESIGLILELPLLPIDHGDASGTDSQ